MAFEIVGSPPQNRSFRRALDEQGASIRTCFATGKISQPVVAPLVHVSSLTIKPEPLTADQVTTTFYAQGHWDIQGNGRVAKARRRLLNLAWEMEDDSRAQQKNAAAELQRQQQVARAALLSEYNDQPQELLKAWLGLPIMCQRPEVTKIVASIPNDSKRNIVSKLKLPSQWCWGRFSLDDEATNTYPLPDYVKLEVCTFDGRSFVDAGIQLPFSLMAIAWEVFRAAGGYSHTRLPRVCGQSIALLHLRHGQDDRRLLSFVMGTIKIEMYVLPTEVISMGESKGCGVRARDQVAWTVNFLGCQNLEDLVIQFQLVGTTTVFSRATHLDGQPLPWAVKLWVWGMRARRRDQQRGLP